jgi:AraC-like DNA-binding protein
VTGDALIVRPGIAHCVAFGERGADVIYLNGLAFPFTAPLAVAATGALAQLTPRAIGGEADAVAELRLRLGSATAPLPANMAAIVRAIEADPMTRMSQAELARRLGMERTRALRRFKAATGLTFRAFKLWSGLQHAARQLEAGVLVRTAAMDAGFADTAHLSRSFRALFGLSPSAAIAGLGQGSPARSL